MYRVLVVDDEKWIRRGLIQSINWEDFGLELAGEAENGDDAYTLALEVQPDLIFLDMRMPGMDGRALLGKLSGELPDVKVIVVSGYADFEYTQEAIRHRAFDYLLKPVRKEELNTVLEKACDELRVIAEKKRAASRAPHSWFRELIRGYGWAYRDSASMLLGSVIPASWKQQELAVFIAQPDQYSEQFHAPDLLSAVQIQLERMKPILFGHGWEYAVACSSGDSRELVVAVSGSQLAASVLERIGALLQQVLRRELDIPVSVGISRVKLNGLGLFEACKEAEVALKSRPLAEMNRVLEALTPAPSISPYPAELERELLSALQTGSESAATKVFSDILRHISRSDVATVAQLQRTTSLIIYAIEKLLQAKGLDFERICGRSPAVCTEQLRCRNDIQSIAQLFNDELLPAIAGCYQRTGATQADKIVNDMKQQVEEYYDQPLSLQSFAQSYYMNQDYLSRIFKKATGRNFIDYLTDVRIHKSKALLKSSSYKNYEIAQMVGYEDYRYFSQIFKKKLGMTIGEYRSTYCQINS